VVPPDSHGISRAPCYLGSHSGGTVVVVYGAVTLCGGPFSWPSTNAALCHSLLGRQPQLNGPTTPTTQRLPAVTRDRFSLFRFRSPLLTESRLLSLPAGNEMFHFPAFPPHALCVQAWVTGHDSCRVSPFGNPRITAWLAAPRGLSQPPTSFIGSWCQGIHRVPLLTWPQRCSRPLCSSQATGGPGLICGRDTAGSGAYDNARSVRTRRLRPHAPPGFTRPARGGGLRREGAATRRRLLPQDPTAC
jgi:hypothetical protein